MSQTSNEGVQRLIDYLEVMLIDEQYGMRKFTKPAPRTFYFADEVDTILVRIDDVNTIIITDGENVVNSLIMKPHFVHNCHHHEEDDQQHLFNTVLQDILHMF